MLHLTDRDKALLNGENGAAGVFAMGLLVRYGEAMGAPHFIDISQAHVDGVIYHGEANIDFVAHVAGLGGRVAVPTTLNVGSMDLIHPELFLGTPAVGAAGRRLMELHEEVGCVPTFTCAPYQTMFRPRFGDQIAWAESNAIAFANSVVGARTDRYGDFTDLAAAITGRVPYVGLHVPENRRGVTVFTVPPDVVGWPGDALAVAVGMVVGIRAGSAVAVIDGLPKTLSEDDLKALGAVAASSGSVALFHAVGITPEAPDLATALGGWQPAETIALTKTDLEDALASLSTAGEGTPLGAVALGTPHFSVAEFARLMPLLDGFSPAASVALYVNTSRETHAALITRGWLARIEAADFTVVVDTCTYVTSVMRAFSGVVMTNSGKWAYYAPANLGVDVAFGAIEDCMMSAALGRVTRKRR